MFYEQAAKLNYPESIYNLGLMYAYGRQGIEIDIIKAMELFKTAAIVYFHAPSMRYLGLLALHFGEIINDDGSAMYWFDKCSQAEDPRFSPKCKSELANLRSMNDEANKYRRQVLETLNQQIHHNGDLLQGSQRE